MSFAQADERKSRNTDSKFRKTHYMSLGEGQHVVHILENPAKKFYVHFVGFSYVKCLGDDCPICENNKKLMFEHPKDFRNQKTWKPRSERFYVNVLDKTKARYCESCDVDYKDLAVTHCSKCNSALPEPAPLNKIRVLAKGTTLFVDTLDLLSNTVRREDDSIVDITNYDWTIVVRGTEKDTITTASPRYNGQEVAPDLQGQELYDLGNAVPELSREEMVDLLNGASLKDIFALRRATKEAGKVKETAPDAVLMGDIQASVDEIFKS